MSDHTKEDTPAVTAGRLMMANVFIKFILKAYDALLHHGVNFKSLPEWARGHEVELDRIHKLPFQRGTHEYVSWVGRLSNAVDAAVRRKGFHVVPRETESDE